MIFKGVELHNIEEVTESREYGGYLMGRVPESLRARLRGMGPDAAYFGCGVELRFNIEDETVRIELKRLPGKGVAVSHGIAEIYNGSFQGKWQESPIAVGNDTVKLTVRKPGNLDLLKRLTKENRLPFDPELVRIFLPYDWGSCLVDIKGKCTPPRFGQTPGTKYLSYGSSITHGGTAVRPSGSYAMRTAQLLGADLINLGFAGSARMEPEMADYIADRKDWDFATLELGVNVIDSWSTSEFSEKIDYFISAVADRNPGKYVFCIDLFPMYRDFCNDAKIKEFRAAVRKKVESVNSPRLVYINGRDLLASAAGLTSDLLHPSENGMEEIARNLAVIMKKHIVKEVHYA